MCEKWRYYARSCVVTIDIYFNCFLCCVKKTIRCINRKIGDSLLLLLYPFAMSNTITL